ncbi:Biotin carboxyl carrier protein of acetyl-CoA carboxylase [bioreactor metagenome]|uniref:Biotin carboxyl carrier protein of acetyl-CoA carboxylase n=1 Tax=bioreactor metagenome TaxID=1076179 RepID=A0A645J9R5_9ZZZZ
MVGVFYSSSAEDAAPFVKVGDTIRKGDVLCIIEAMKLMNEITAEQDGVVAEVCAGNNQMVDFGHVLFRLKKE